MKKTNKAILTRELEKKAIPAKCVSPSSACFIDGMGLIQKMRGENCSFAKLSGQVFGLVSKIGDESESIDVIIEVYKNASIKSNQLNGCRDGLMTVWCLPTSFLATKSSSIGVCYFALHKQSNWSSYW